MLLAIHAILPFREVSEPGEGGGIAEGAVDPSGFASIAIVDREGSALDRFAEVEEVPCRRDFECFGDWASVTGSDIPRSLPRLATPTPQVNVVLYPEHSLPWSKHCEQ